MRATVVRLPTLLHIRCLGDVWCSILPFHFFPVSLSIGMGLVPPPVAVRPASPLPPGVPTGPRNQNKYKDRDGNAPAVDGLDYGGNKDVGGRTPSGEPEERSSSRCV